MVSSLALLAKIDNLGIPGLTVLVVLGIIFWRPILKKIYTIADRKKGIKCFVCNKESHDFILDNDFNAYCRDCGEAILHKK